jgi:hypothetical protein
MLKTIVRTLTFFFLIAFLTLGAFHFLDPEGFIDRKREFRIAMGLPKLWVKDFNTDTVGYERAACPSAHAIVIVTGGQSNAANGLSSPVFGDRSAKTFMVQDAKCWKLRDPVLGATSKGGSLWTELGTSLYRETKRPVVFINGAVGGSQVADWLDDRSGYRQRLIKNIEGARSVGLSPNFVVWVQGETDAAARVPPDVYVAQLNSLINRFNTDSNLGHDVRWIIYRSTNCSKLRNTGSEIDKAVENFVANSPQIILGPNASALGDNYRRDGCHFNAKGRKILNDQAVPIILNYLRPQTERPVTTLTD